MESDILRKRLSLFIAVVVVISIIVEAIICLGGPAWLTALLMWIPAITAIIVNRNIEIGFRKYKLKYIF